MIQTYDFCYCHFWVTLSIALHLATLTLKKNLCLCSCPKPLACMSGRNNPSRSLFRSDAWPTGRLLLFYLQGFDQTEVLMCRFPSEPGKATGTLAAFQSCVLIALLEFDNAMVCITISTRSFLMVLVSLSVFLSSSFSAILSVGTIALSMQFFMAQQFAISILAGFCKPFRTSGLMSTFCAFTLLSRGCFSIISLMVLGLSSCPICCLLVLSVPHAEQGHPRPRTFSHTSQGCQHRPHHLPPLH